MRMTADQYKKKLPTESEAGFQRWVINTAHIFGWKVAHFRPAMNQRGKWMTPVQADGAGFPDCVLANSRQRRLIIAELKREDGKLSDKQKEWLDTLTNCNVETYCWKPSMRDDIERILKGEVEG
jgi:hypothetical protein